MLYRRTVMTPLGPIEMVDEGGSLCKIRYVEQMGPSEESPLLLQVQEELEEYFQGKRRTFDLPLAPLGTAFQMKVWRVLQSIPYGEVTTYGALAEAVGSPKGARAVGNACNKNPLPILIPCHRVVARDGNLTGYGGGLAKKEYLLKLESPR